MLIGDYKRFADSTPKCQLEGYFLSANLGYITKPTTIVDKHGKIFLWYLPGFYSPLEWCVLQFCLEILVFTNFMVRMSLIGLWHTLRNPYLKLSKNQ